MELEEPMSEVQMSPDQIVEAMPEYLIPEKAATTKATIQFDLSGDAGGKWWVRINDGKAESGKGDPGEPANLTLLADANDWVKIMTGRVHAGQAEDQRRYGPGDQDAVDVPETELGSSQ